MKGLKSLRCLILGGTSVTDAGLEHLKALADLERLDVRRINVTDEDVEKLQQALPNCKIVR